MDLHIKLRRDDGTSLSQPTRYRELVGSLIHLSATRLNIFLAVYVLSQLVSAPTLAYYAVLLHVFYYLQSTISRSLLYSSDSSPSLRAYFDAEWVDDPDIRCSTTDFCIFLGSSHFLV